MGILDEDSYKIEEYRASNDSELGMQYLEFLYSNNLKLDKEISSMTEEFVTIDKEHNLER